MLAVFEKCIGNPPAELSLPSVGSKTSRSRQEIVEVFRSAWPESTIYNLSNGNCMALSHKNENHQHPRSIVVVEDIFCIFVGNLENICDLRRHYGLSRQINEGMLVVEVYKVVRDRAPYPPDQVIKDLSGKFAFILFDSKYAKLFAARDRGGGVKFQWGVAGDGSLVFSDDIMTIAEACGNSCTAFPPGCMFMNGSGLASFDHPLHKVRAVANEDDDGHVSAVIFKVDLYTRLHSIPRTGSSSNWADTTIVDAEY